MIIRPLDKDRLRREFNTAKPYPHCAIEGFLDDAFAREVASAYPSFEAADKVGRQFKAVNEYRKVQITDSNVFPAPVRKLHEALAHPDFLRELSFITGIDSLLADAELAGGGMHITGPRGRLDVHVDFNVLPERKLYRRLNLLLYLNPHWERSWGGAVELWDDKVEVLHHAFEPQLNRCVIFETSNRSFHGVEPVTCPPHVQRQSFATYYYTTQAPPDYVGTDHNTIFRPRPDERLKKYVLMPAERAKNALVGGRRKARETRDKIKRLLGRD